MSQSAQFSQETIRNIAIIAHVDHGKTTLVDAMLKQTATFAAHQKENEQTTIMDSNELERERGVTILAKNTSVFWHEYKINILDTPGHSDFSGEVERVLNMADGCILLVDAAEGVLSQTKFVLGLALKLGLRPIVVINKVDRKDQRIAAVEQEVGDLFLELATDESQLDFPVLYASGIAGFAGKTLQEQPDFSMQITDSTNLEPLFTTIVQRVPAPKGDRLAPFRMQVTSLDWDTHLGKMSIGRISDGKVSKGQKVVLLRHDTNKPTFFTVNELFTYHGLQRQAITEAAAGMIIALTGIDDPHIGDTVAENTEVEQLPQLTISQPTVKMTMSVNSSPFSGRDATFSTSRQLKTRIERELETNVGLRMEVMESGEQLTIVGRGELHLAILIETMRREGYEFSLSRPEVVLKTIDGVLCEPWEEVEIEVPEEFIGAINVSMSARQGEMQGMKHLKNGVRFEYHIATGNLIGYRSELLTTTSGQAVINSSFMEYRAKGTEAEWHRGGAVISHETGTATAYALYKAQQRTKLIVDVGEEVYGGQVVGFNSRSEDMVFNVTKNKKLTNMRASSADKTVVVAPAWKPSLEQFLTLIAPDEMLEVTPEFLRLRKKDLKVAA